VEAILHCPLLVPLPTSSHLPRYNTRHTSDQRYESECSVQRANPDISQFHNCTWEWRCEKEGMWNWTGIRRRDERVTRVTLFLWNTVMVNWRYLNLFYLIAYWIIWWQL